MSSTTTTPAVQSLYDAQVLDARGKPFDLSSLRGKVVLIVNVASKCGFTPQYDGLEQLYQRYRDRGLVILGFPCNQFMGQAPGTASDQESFCKLNHGVTFPILQIVDVNGPNTHPLYVWLKSQRAGFLWLHRIWWNFEKFLVDSNGQVLLRAGPTASPASLEAAIEAALPEATATTTTGADSKPTTTASAAAKPQL